MSTSVELLKSVEFFKKYNIQIDRIIHPNSPIRLENILKSFETVSFCSSDFVNPSCHHAGCAFHFTLHGSLLYDSDDNHPSCQINNLAYEWGGENDQQGTLLSLNAVKLNFIKECIRHRNIIKKAKQHDSNK